MGSLLQIIYMYSDTQLGRTGCLLVLVFNQFETAAFGIWTLSLAIYIYWGATNLESLEPTKTGVPEWNAMPHTCNVGIYLFLSEISSFSAFGVLFGWLGNSFLGDWFFSCMSSFQCFISSLGR